MSHITIKEGLTFNDVLLTPKFSNIESRSAVSTAVKFPKGFYFHHPLIPANMASISGFDMSQAISRTHGLSIIHRFMPIEDQLDIVRVFRDMSRTNKWNYMRDVGFSVGAKKENRSDIDKLIDAGVEILCIDIAHGDSKICIDTIKYIVDKYPKILLIAGNVATGDAAYRLWDAGADVVKCGIGPSTICTTRIMTGNGVPQLSALINIAEMRERCLRSVAFGIMRDIGIISDGGAVNSGDCVKALCFADMIMSGFLFAGCSEALGQIIEIDGKSYKQYNGSSTLKTTHIEGVKSIVPTKGKVKDIVENLLQGIRSGLSYQGVSNLIDLKREPEFVKITQAGWRESGSHDVKMVE